MRRPKISDSPKLPNTLLASPADRPLSRSIGTVLVTIVTTAATTRVNAMFRNQKLAERMPARKTMPGSEPVSCAFFRAPPGADSEPAFAGVFIQPIANGSTSVTGSNARNANAACQPQRAIDQVTAEG